MFARTIGAMIKRSLPCFVLAAWTVAGVLSTARAQQTPPPVDPNAVLAAVKDLRAKQTGIITREKSGVLAAINAALADPARLTSRP